MKIMPTLAFAMLGLTATPGTMQTGTVQTGPVQTAYDIAASAPVTKADVPAPQGVVVADRSNGIAAPAPAAPAKYDPGASSTEIKIGNIMPYTARPRPTA